MGHKTISDAAAQQQWKISSSIAWGLATGSPKASNSTGGSLDVPPNPNIFGSGGWGGGWGGRMPGGEFALGGWYILIFPRSILGVRVGWSLQFKIPSCDLNLVELSKIDMVNVDVVNQASGPEILCAHQLQVPCMKDHPWMFTEGIWPPQVGVSYISCSKFKIGWGVVASIPISWKWCYENNSQIFFVLSSPCHP